MPLTRPLEANVNPDGSEPEIRLNWYGRAGPQPPAPPNVNLYGDPSVPAGGK
jgi:hypothetical protein